jgi:hypothetical protein
MLAAAFKVSSVFAKQKRNTLSSNPFVLKTDKGMDAKP